MLTTRVVFSLRANLSLKNKRYRIARGDRSRNSVTDKTSRAYPVSRRTTNRVTVEVVRSVRKRENITRDLSRRNVRVGETDWFKRTVRTLHRSLRSPISPLFPRVSPGKKHYRHNAPITRPTAGATIKIKPSKNAFSIH